MNKVGNFFKGQWVVLNWTARFSSFLSLMGSITIIYMILRRRKVRLALVHNRLLMGMSIYDVLGNIGYLGGSAAAPAEKADRIYGAIGNDATCTAQGILLFMGLSVPLYNCFLSVYYLLVIRYEVRDEVLKKYEKYMHLFVFLATMSFIIQSLVFNVISYTGGIYCTLSAYPANERDTKNIGSTLISILTGWNALNFVVIATCMLGIYCKVKAQAVTMNQYPSIQNANGERNQHSNTRQYDDTKTQALLYVVAYMLTYIFLAIGVAIDDDSNFGLSLMISITLPLQGFWNLLNFVRPKFIAIRQKNLSKPFSWVLKASIFSSLDEEEQKKRLASRRSTFRRNFTPISNSEIRAPTRTSLSVHDEENPKPFECDNNSRRRSCDVIGTQQYKALDGDDDDDDDDAGSKSHVASSVIPPVSLTELIAYDKLLDRTRFIDDTRHRKTENKHSNAGQMKRRHSLPSAFFSASLGEELN